MDHQPVSESNNTPKNNNGRGWRRIFLIGCVLFVFLIMCACGGVVLLASVSNSGLSMVENQIEETTEVELGNDQSLTTSKIAVIDFSGIISYVVPGDTLSSGTNNRSISSQILKAKRDNSVKAVILRFNTPGGAVLAAEPICRDIKDLAKTKPVYAFIDSQGASLGYLLPNCTDFLYSRPDSITGSIGVIMSLTDYNGIIEKLGGRTANITNSAGTEKSGEGYFDPKSDEYKRLQSILDESYEYFLSKVWEGREKHGKISKPELRAIADGRIFSGQQAYDTGLVDSVMYYDEVLSDVVKKNSDKFGEDKIEVVDYSILGNPFSNIFGLSHFISQITTSEGSVKINKLELLYVSKL